MSKTIATKDQILFTIDGFTVYKGRTYRSDDKPDGDAPSGFVAARVSKLPSDGVDESFHFRYITPRGSREGLWDTGFYQTSPCFLNMDEKEAALIARERVKNILDPYRKATGAKTALDTSDPASLDTTSWHVHSGMVYNTNNPIDVMRLYVTLLTGNAAPAGNEKSARYSTSAYLIVDVTKVSKDKEDKNVSVMKTVSMFNKLLETDTEQLDVVLKWLNLGKYPRAVDAETKASIFYETIKDSSLKCRLFLETVESLADNKEKTKLYIYYRLEENKNKNSKVYVANNGRVFYEETELGGDFKTAAETIAKNPDMAAIRAAILANTDLETETED